MKEASQLARWLVFGLASTSAVAQSTIPVSVDATGATADGASIAGDVSSDGSIVSFTSAATNLVAGDSNGVADVFVLDRASGVLERVSIAAGGIEADAASVHAALSGDGRHVAFVSVATNLVAGAANGLPQLYVRDRCLGTLVHASRDASGNSDAGFVAAAGLGDDGARIAFVSTAPLVANDGNGVADVYLRDLVAGTTTLIGLDATGLPIPEGVGSASLSADGRFVAFTTAAALDPADANGVEDVYRRNLATGVIKLASVTATGSAGDGASSRCHLSGDGAVVAFTSHATDFVAGDGNGRADAFARDFAAAATQRLSVATTGSEGAGGAGAASEATSISRNGRFVVFRSDVDGLDLGDANGFGDVFVRDLQIRHTERVSVGTLDEEPDAPSFSSSSAIAGVANDGATVVFSSDATTLATGDANARRDVFLRSRFVDAPATVIVSVDANGDFTNGASFNPRVTGDGRYAVFSSTATDLDKGDVDYWAADVYRKDLRTGAIVLVSVSSTQKKGNNSSVMPSISADGRFVAFMTSSSNLRYGGNGKPQVYLRDIEAGTLELLSIATDGSLGDRRSGPPQITPDGRFVFFESEATNLVDSDTNGWADVFVRDVAAGTTTRVTYGDQGAELDYHSTLGDVTPDGRYVAFATAATNVVTGDTNGRYDAFVRDLATGTNVCASVDAAGAPGNSSSGYYGIGITPDGSQVVFSSQATNLIANDTNPCEDVFVRDLVAGVTTRVSVTSDGAQCGTSMYSYALWPWISNDGRFVTFASNFDELEGLANRNAYVHDRVTGTTQQIDLTWDHRSGALYVELDPLGGYAFTDDLTQVVFTSSAPLAPGEGTGFDDVFLRRRHTESAWSEHYGRGLAGTNGIPALDVSPPQLNTLPKLTLGNSLGAPTMALLWIGTQRCVVSTAGGELLVVPATALCFHVPAGGLSFRSDLGDDDLLQGLDLFLQAIELDDGAPRGLSFTQGVALEIGN